MVRTTIEARKPSEIKTKIKYWWSALGPRTARYSCKDLARGAIGALLGILIASLVGKWLSVGDDLLPFIVAPIGATAVLVFVAPASPLAQPWSVLAGNVSSTLVGITVGRIFDDDMTAAAIAVGVAIIVMMLLRCVHPPGGACALFAAVGGPVVQRQGFAFAIWPIGVNTFFLIVAAALVNNLTGRPYPHVPEPPPPTATGSDRAPRSRIGVQTEDIERAMSRTNQGLDIMPADVMVLVHDAETEALDRRLGEVRCDAIMARDVVTLHADDNLYRARVLLNQHHVKALPVVDVARHVVGIVTVYDLFNVDIADLAPATSVMSWPVVTVRETTPVAELVGLMTDRDLRHVPVVDATGALAGIVTRAELIALLNRALLGY